MFALRSSFCFEKGIKIISGWNKEALIWIMFLIFLAFSNPEAQPYFNLCVFKFFGINRCPGCGLGHAISYLFHGDIVNSFKSHPLGLFAVIVILLRIIRLLTKYSFPQQIINQTK
jgi:hypothetical protein